ncbi:MAG: SOS response-associated peptidase [Anaerolineae bacterium]|nr:SOS response-associated peptidase [Anaerolineae bacterium]
MCGRFTLTELAPDVITELFNLGGDVPSLSPRYNIAPSQPVATVIRNADSGENRLAIMRWGLIPSWAKDHKVGNRLINTRSETVHEKPSFRAAFKRRRCLVLADGFYEWQKVGNHKQPVYITLKQNEPFAFAGLWELWTDGATGDEHITCTIITTRPNNFMQPIHRRMPVILPREHYDHWLRPDQEPEVLRALMEPYPDEAMVAWPVSRRVNSPANDDPALIEEAV